MRNIALRIARSATQSIARSATQSRAAQPNPKNWYIYYRFYDPVQTAKFPQGKLRIIKGMNEFQTVPERQEATKALIDVELNELKNLGFNPIIETIKIRGFAVSLIDTPFQLHTGSFSRTSL